jgi:hypothetical protein
VCLRHLIASESCERGLSSARGLSSRSEKDAQSLSGEHPDRPDLGYTKRGHPQQANLPGETTHPIAAPNAVTPAARRRKLCTVVWPRIRRAGERTGANNTREPNTNAL